MRTRMGKDGTAGGEKTSPLSLCPLLTLTPVSAPARSSSATLGASFSAEAMRRRRSQGARPTVKREREREGAGEGWGRGVRSRAVAFPGLRPHSRRPPSSPNKKLTLFQLVQAVVVALGLPCVCACVCGGGGVRGGGAGRREDKEGVAAAGAVVDAPT